MKTRAREDNALEVMIGRQLVGWLTDYQNLPCRNKSIDLVRNTVDSVWGDISENRRFEITIMNRSYDHHDLESHDKEWRLTHIPGYAEQNSRFDGKDVCSWAVLSLTQDEFDWVFDYSHFEPADTKRDTSVDGTQPTIDEEMAERLSNMLDAAVYGVLTNGSAGLNTFATAMTNTAKAANESTVSVEKLLDAMRLLGVKR